MSHSTSRTLAFLSRNFLALCLSLLVGAAILIVVLHSRSLSRERLRRDAQMIQTARPVGYAIELPPKTAPSALTVSAPRTLASTKDETADSDSTAPHTFSPSDLSELETSITWYEGQIAQSREKKRDSRWYEEHREALLKRRAELLAAIPEMAPAKPGAAEGY